MKKILGEVIGKYLAVAVVPLIILGSVMFCVSHVVSDAEAPKNNSETAHTVPVRKGHAGYFV